MNKVLTLERLKEMSQEEIINAYRNGYVLEGIERAGCSSCERTNKESMSNRHPISSLVTCTKTSGVVGNVVTLKSTPTTGTAPYTVKFWKDTTLLTTFTNVPENTLKTYNYTLVAADIGSRIFKVDIADSCASTAKTCAEQCTVTVTAACVTPVCNFILE